MVSKKIQATLGAKVVKWIGTIQNTPLRTEVYKHAFICGGCISSLMLNETPNDYDVYFDSLSVASSVKKYYEGKVSKNDQDYLPIFSSDTAITLSGDIQIITKFTGPRETIVDNFDFIHTKAVYSLNSNTLHIPAEMYEPVFNKQLIYTGSDYPIVSLVRIRKFIKRGWNISAGQILKICFDVQKVDIKTISGLREQLSGVDSAYFAVFLASLETTADGYISYENAMTAIDEAFSENQPLV